MPKLEAIFYVRSFAQPIADNGIMLVEAWDMDAIPVTEMALAQILLTCRGYYRTYKIIRKPMTKARQRTSIGQESMVRLYV